MQVEIIYASDKDVYREQLELPHASTVANAIESSCLLERHPELDWNINKVGIYGRLVATDALLQDKDRVEIYRPLKARKPRKSRLS